MSDTVIVQETAPFADVFPTLEAAERYIREHDAEVVQLTRRSVAVLREDYRRDLVSRHIISVSGGVPRKRYDLVSYLAESRFPRLQAAQAVRAWHRNRTEHARYIISASMQLSLASDENLAEIIRAVHPSTRARLRIILAAIGDEEEKPEVTL